MEPLPAETITDRLPTGWRLEDDALVRDYRFAGFRDAIDFIVAIADSADAANHHPELTNVYNRVSVRLTTHDAGNKVTAKDLALAAEIEALPRRDA